MLSRESLGEVLDGRRVLDSTVHGERRPHLSVKSGTGGKAASALRDRQRGVTAFGQRGAPSTSGQWGETVASGHRKVATVPRLSLGAFRGALEEIILLRLDVEGGSGRGLDKQRRALFCLRERGRGGRLGCSLAAREEVLSLDSLWRRGGITAAVQGIHVPMSRINCAGVGEDDFAPRHVAVPCVGRRVGVEATGGGVLLCGTLHKWTLGGTRARCETRVSSRLSPWIVADGAEDWPRGLF